MRRADDFDIAALFSALDQRRVADGLSWAGAARAIWAQSEALNLRRESHPISPSTLTNMRTRGDTTCQHALFMLRWLGRAPEEFIASPAQGTAGVPLPEADAEHRLRWNLKRLYGALDAARTSRGATWREAADRIGCSPNQLTGLRTAKYATGMRLAMRICQTLHRPAADFVYSATW